MMLEAGIVAQQFGDATALFQDGQFPAAAVQFRLILPLEQMHEQEFQPIGELATLRTTHGFQLLDQVLNTQAS